MKNKFPFSLNREDAKRIIDIACSPWKIRLSKDWGASLLLEGSVTIHANEYKSMRDACTPQQHDLFDEIFGTDYEVEVGDIVVVTKAYQDNRAKKGKIGKLIEVDIYPPLYKILLEEDEKTSWCTDVRLATREELGNYCPYEDGELIFIRVGLDNTWSLRYSTGKLSHGKAETYDGQKTSGATSIWNYHTPAKGIKLPE